MVTTLERDQLSTLGRGFAVLGSGGGGTTTLWQLILPNAPIWPLTVHDIDDLPASTPCVAVGFGGSTMLMSERLPGDAPFAELVDAAERWTGVRARAVCGIEAAGLNGMSPFSLAKELAVVDADLMGRALPRLDQMSLLVDNVPGLVAVCSTGAGGVVVIDTGRAADVESIVRSAIVQAGGLAPMLLAGFTVGDLREHSILGGMGRALQLGAAFDDDPTPSRIDALAERLGARVLGSGRVSVVEPSPDDAYSLTVEVRGDDGAVLRLIARSENLAFMRDGVVDAATPEIIVALDSISHEVLQADDLTSSSHITVVVLRAPEWWTSAPHRLAHVAPAAYGLGALSDASSSSVLAR